MHRNALHHLRKPNIFIGKQDVPRSITDLPSRPVFLAPKKEFQQPTGSADRDVSVVCCGCFFWILLENHHFLKCNATHVAISLFSTSWEDEWISCSWIQKIRIKLEKDFQHHPIIQNHPIIPKIRCFHVESPGITPNKSSNAYNI